MFLFPGLRRLNNRSLHLLSSYTWARSEGPGTLLTLTTPREGPHFIDRELRHSRGWAACPSSQLLRGKGRIWKQETRKPDLQGSCAGSSGPDNLCHKPALLPLGQSMPVSPGQPTGPALEPVLGSSSGRGAQRPCPPCGSSGHSPGLGKAEVFRPVSEGSFSAFHCPPSTEGHRMSSLPGTQAGRCWG